MRGGESGRHRLRRRSGPARIPGRSSGFGGRYCFSGVEEFYAADQRRERSRELDFGVLWQSSDERFIRGPHRLSWVADTGELYWLALTPVRFHGPLPERLRIVARVRDEDEVERVLTGWAEACGAKDGLDWIVGRLRREGLLIGGF